MTAEEARPRVLVGVDGSERNLAAVDWAAREALATGVALHLVGVAKTTRDDDLRQYAEDETDALLHRVAARVALVEPSLDVGTEVRVGQAVEGLRDAQRRGDVLVVGRRGIGLVHRMVLGSTSTALVGRSTGPVVVVPDGYVAADRRTVVAGVDGTERDEGVLEVAFRDADRHELRLVVVSAGEMPVVFGWDQSELDAWSKVAEERLRERLAPWQTRFPHVDLSCWAPPVSPANALVDASADAYVLVVGRFAGPQHFEGFSGFSTVRWVLQHAACPVAVVPVATPDDRFDETDVPEF